MTGPRRQWPRARRSVWEAERLRRQWPKARRARWMLRERRRCNRVGFCSICLPVKIRAACLISDLLRQVAPRVNGGWDMGGPGLLSQSGPESPAE